MAQIATPTNAAMAARLERDVANLQGDLTIAKRKLSSKTEALIILTADLDSCRTERDQYKLMAEQLQARHVAIKKQLAGWLAVVVVQRWAFIMMAGSCHEGIFFR